MRWKQKIHGEHDSRKLKVQNKERRGRSGKTRQQKSTMFVFAIMHECMRVLISVKKQSERNEREGEGKKDGKRKSFDQNMKTTAAKPRE